MFFDEYEIQQSVNLLQLGKIDVIGHQVCSVPLLRLSRDVVFHAIGCDCMQEDGSILISASNVDDDNDYPDFMFPPVPKRWGSARMYLRNFQAKIDILGPKHARTRLIANVDPNLFLPNWLIDFFMKKIAGVLLVSLLRKANKIKDNPECKHAKRIKEDTKFYDDWVLPKCIHYCKGNYENIFFIFLSIILILMHFFL